ncbi:MAG: ATP-binding protein [Clostridiales bacterium]|nr:ATP-binding protein [Clostridiales bacterium]
MFVGRKKELELLNRQYDSGDFEFTVVYGRRRVGKTELIKHFARGKNSIYYMSLESNAQTNLEFLSRSVHRKDAKMSALAPFLRFDSLFDYLAEISRDKRLIFIIDEYPYLAQAVPEISSLIQKYCDHVWKETKLHLILCGSSMSFMENQILGEKSPLYGRRTAQIRLKAFNYFETEEFLRPMPKEDIAVLHSATGGVAEYLNYVDKKSDLENNLISMFFSDSGRLYEEPMNYLKQELREPKVYNEILNAVANGASKNNEIASRVRLQSGALNRYLDSLIELGIIARKFPIGSSSPRKTIYRISDGLFRFWYRFVFPNMSAIELGTGKRLYRDYIEKNISKFMGESFEHICMDHFDRMNERGELPVLVTQRGRWWGNNPTAKREEEIDLVGFGGDTTIFSEVKWTQEKVDLQVIRGLIDKSALIPSKKRHYLFFSKNGFTRGALEYAQGEENISLVTFLR